MSQGAFTLKEPKFEPGWKIAGTRDGKPVELEGGDVVRLTLTSKPPAVAHGPQVILPTGEQIVGDVLELADEELTLRSHLLGEVKLPITVVRAVVFDLDVPIALLGSLREGRAAVPNNDAAFLKNGDTTLGTLAGMTRSKFTLTINGADRDLARDNVLAVAFDPGLVDYKTDTSLYAQIRLADGTLLNAKSIESAKAGLLKVTTAFGTTVNVAVGEVVDVSFRNGRVVYLSDLEPAKAEHEPYLGDPMAMRKDRSVLNEPLRLAGRVYPKGLGVRSRSMLAYSAAGYRRFEATVGLDESAGPAASVRFVVKADGKPAYEGPEMTAGSNPERIAVDLAGAKEIQLVVEYARRGDIQDFANWCDARLVR